MSTNSEPLPSHTESPNLAASTNDPAPNGSPHPHLSTSHESTVTTISQRVAHFHASGTKFRIFHGGSNSTRAQSFHRDRIIDTSSLTNILSINTSTTPPTILCEPNISFSELVRASIPHGLIPKVVPELPAITVGGAYSGTSGESSSYIHGFVEDTVRRVRVVLGDGEVVWAERDGENADLLECAAGSFGTLGVVVALEVECLWLGDLAYKTTMVREDAKGHVEGEKKREERYVMQLEVQLFSSTAHLIHAMEQACAAQGADGITHIDAILFSATSGALMLGRITTASHVRTQGLRLTRFTRARDQWFYRLIEKRLSALPHSNQTTTSTTPTSFTLAIPLYDYLFRYNRGAFWGGKHAFHYFLTPYNRITRFLLDPLMHTSTMFHAFHESGLGSQFVVQDIGFPRRTVEKFLSYIESELGFWPIWLCPLKKGGRLPMMRAQTGHTPKETALREDLLINVGIWGPGRKSEREFVNVNRDIERVTAECWGAKCLYARAYYTEEEFWSVYDREGYDGARMRWRAEGLAGVWEKTCVDLGEVEKRVADEKRLGRRVRRMRPFAGYYGAGKAVLGLVWKRRAREYVLAKKGK